MGTDYEAITIVGLRITLDQILKPVTKTVFNDCHHDNNHLHVYKFCPTCGKQNICIIEYSDFIDGVDEYGSEYQLIINNHKYDIIKPITYEDYLYVIVYVGIKDGQRNYDKSKIVKYPHILEELITGRNVMKEDLSSIELWNDDEFGLYTLFEVSY